MEGSVYCVDLNHPGIEFTSPSECLAWIYTAPLWLCLSLPKANVEAMGLGLKEEEPEYSLFLSGCALQTAGRFPHLSP